MLLKAGAGLDIMNLNEAAAAGCTDIVKLLLAAGVNPNEHRVASGEAPLTRVAEKGHVEVVKLLLEAGASLEGRYEKPIDVAESKAVAKGYVDIVDLLINVGADVQPAAVTECHVEVVESLLKAGADAKALPGMYKIWTYENKLMYPIIDLLEKYGMGSQ
ncbi:hypothetical protein HDV00_011193 [Rhizophlyctis rosea]|nr:hypothetical protein HDV00_011193 [Rhizophlyctis rosea]